MAGGQVCAVGALIGVPLAVKPAEECIYFIHLLHNNYNLHAFLKAIAKHGCNYFQPSDQNTLHIQF